ncbi:MAG: collagen binding domain-containing protein, partial [Paenibacillus sp.]|nr:collagen binding domain-containing protein [Paenibacillus sp.]
GGYGTYEVLPSGQVTFTFSDLINDNAEVVGQFFVWAEFEKGKFSGSTEQEVVFDFKGDQVKIPVHFKPEGNQNISKTGSANKVFNPDRIDWKIDFNQGEHEIHDAVFKDQFVPKEGLSLDLSSVQVILLDVQLDGSVVERDPLVLDQDYSIAETENGFAIDMGTITHAYRVAYSTDIMKPVDTAYSNKAELTGSNDPPSMETSTSVQVRYSKPLNKRVVNYHSASQTVTWAIEFNYNEQPLAQQDAWIKDTFDTNIQHLLTDSFEVYEMEILANGQAKRKSNTPLVKGTDYEVSSSANGFDLAFLSDVNAAYEIVYQTKAADRVFNDDKVSNAVESKNSGKIEVSQGIKQVIFVKQAGKVDFSEKTIEWKIWLNEDQKTMHNVVLADQFADQGLTLIPDTLSVSGLEEHADYTLEPNPDYGSGLKITFLHDVTDRHAITYKTAFNPTYYDPSEIKGIVYHNQATLHWLENGENKSMSQSAQAELDPYTKHNGNKKGAYDAKTKEITWTIDINYNLHKIQQAVVRDYYTGVQHFEPSSVKVEHLILTGDRNGVKIGEQVPSEDYTVELKQVEEKDGFELKFLKPIDSAYRITYKTSLEGRQVEKEYMNKATLEDLTNPDRVLFEKGTTVSPKHGGEFVSKHGVQGSGMESEFAQWEVAINYSQSFIQGAVYSDTLSDNQLLLKDSIRLYNTTVTSAGDLIRGGLVDESQYTLDVQGNSFKLSFLNGIQEAYMLRYQSFINADDGEIIANEAKLVGQSTTEIEAGDHSDFVVSLAGAGGGAAKGKGHIKVLKVDGDTEVPLAGAVFGLYDKTGSTLLEKAVTNEQGEAEFKSYRYNSYLLKELAAPEGYLMSSEYEAGKLI